MDSLRKIRSARGLYQLEYVQELSHNHDMCAVRAKSFTLTQIVPQGNAGGAILAYKGSTLNIDRSSFIGNVAANDGGAIQQLGGVINIGNSSFSQNTAASIGGAYFGSDVVRT